ncbi:DNA-(apurinic or apyrimidinic site) lyase [Coniothyrium glycines]
MARKLARPASDPPLSPSSDGLVSTTEVVATESITNGMKRKAVTSVKTTTKRAKKTSASHATTEDGLPVPIESPRPKRRAVKKAIIEEDAVEQDVKVVDDDEGVTTVKKITKRKKKSDDKDDGEQEVEVKEKTAKRKPKAVKNEAPLAERTKDIKLRVGAHVSAAGGVQNSITNLLHIGGNAFALFLKNQRKWDNIELDPEAATQFIEACKEHSISAAECCLPHGSYLVNLAHPDETRKKQAYDSFLNDLIRCNTLGIKLYNFHPGNANATTHEEGLKLIAENINRAHQDPATGTVMPVLETMASLGNTIGGTFADIAGIIAHVKDKSRIGVCIDTCHVFAAGYDLRSPEAYASTMSQFDEIVGFEYLKAFHINDSKAPLASHRDLHARIGTGYLGLRAFHNLMNDTRFHGLPMVLETPIDVIGADGKKIEDKGVWAREIKMLESLVGMDVEDEEFKQLEAKLQDEGKAERDRIGEQVSKKSKKDAAPKKKRGKKVDTEDEDEE